MKIDNRTLRAVGSMVLLVVLVLVASRFGGSDDGSDTAIDPDSSPSSSSSSSSGARPGPPSSSATGSDSDTGSVDPQSGLPFIEESDLPDQAIDVLAAIDDGGPFDHPSKDGSTFGNFEGVLPDESRGYYREYTVETPGSSDRGARRIVTGGAGPASYFWTDDHYDSFSRIRR